MPVLPILFNQFWYAYHFDIIHVECSSPSMRICTYVEIRNSYIFWKQVWHLPWILSCFLGTCCLALTQQLLLRDKFSRQITNPFPFDEKCMLFYLQRCPTAGYRVPVLSSMSCFCLNLIIHTHRDRVGCWFNAIDFLSNPGKRQSIARALEQEVGSLLWNKSFEFYFTSVNAVL